MKHWGLALLISTTMVGISGCDSVPRQINPFAQQALYSQTQYAQLKQRAIEQSLVVDAATGQLSFVGDTEYVILSDFQFSPERIQLKSGTITRIRVSNTAWVTHYFGGHKFFELGAEVVSLMDSDIPEHQRHIPVSPFTERDIYLFVKDPGEYPLNCFVPNHRKAGMEGVLIVEAVDKTSEAGAVE